MPKKLKRKRSVGWMHRGTRKFFCHKCYPRRPEGKNWFRVTDHYYYWYKDKMPWVCFSCGMKFVHWAWKPSKGIEAMASAVSENP